MPRQYAMTWEGPARRWRKMHKGKYYTISCTQLGVGETKEASFKAANDWWAAKKKDLDNPPQPAHPHQPIIDRIDRRILWAKEQGLPDLVENLEVSKYNTEALPHWEADRIEALMGLNLGNLADFKGWDESSPAPVDRTLGHQTDKYLEFQLARHRSGQISVSDYDQTRQYLAAFRGWLGDATPVEVIDASKWEEWYVFLLNCGKSIDTKKKRFRRARDFVQWLAEKGMITPPSNLLARRYRFKAEEKAIRTLSRDEVRAMIGAAPGQLRLHLLLMANCGFLQQDVADLTQGEVDWERGIITRRRSKTGDHAHVPTVSYRLWAETFELLKRFRSNHPTLALTTQSGLPWVRDLIDEKGIRRRVDAIKSNYAHIAKRHKFKPMSLLRKTAASKLEESPEYGRYAQHFLGHAPTSIAQRHYVTPSQEQFDRAMTWLGEVFGF